MNQKKPEERIQGGHLLARAMAEKGIKKVFSLSGGFLNPLFDGCLEYGIEVVGTRNEQEAGFLANMWARLTREPAVCIAEPSGFTNYISAVAEAYYSGDPVIYISSASNFNALDKNGFKEMPQHRIVEPMTKYSIMVTSGPRLPEYFDKAYDIAINRPTGPVELSIPVNWLFSHYETTEKDDERPFILRKRKIHQAFPDPEDVNLIVKTLMSAKRPVLIAGSGVWQSDAEKDLEEFSINTQIPFFHSNHLEIRANDFGHPLYMGLADIHQNPASRLIKQSADVAIFLGCKVDYTLDFGNPPLFNKDMKLIAVNPTSRELSDNHIADITVLADVKRFLQELRKKANVPKIDSGWAHEITQARKNANEEWSAYATSKEIPIHPLRACCDVLNSLGAEDFLVVDGGDAHGWQETALNITSMNGKKVKGISMSGPFAQLGVGVSFATAIKMLHPNSRVVLISGDGAFGLAPGLPMETAIRYKVPIVVVVLNNQSWGMIKNQQKAMWKRTCETDLRDIPFHKMIEGSGGQGFLVEKPEDLVPTLERSFTSNVPTIINVKTKDVISLITVGLVDKREKSSIE
jgi:acetolactate synthase I/II/III large subunit